ncbi:MAG: hypothetical protein LBR10_00385 [Prevotellaceae bacterium]|jgi:hypothetical protein|nr:hypothetical protein [Prevotellaceae bacterium]
MADKDSYTLYFTAYDFAHRSNRPESSDSHTQVNDLRNIPLYTSVRNASSRQSKAELKHQNPAFRAGLMHKTNARNITVNVRDFKHN